MYKNRGERDRLEVDNPKVKMDKTPGETDSLWVRDRQTRGEEHTEVEILGIRLGMDLGSEVLPQVEDIERRGE